MATSPLVVIVGETASGKSDLAMRIAKIIGGEIICADSRTVYKYMDVSTAKSSTKDQQEVPHHMLDIVTPDQHYDVSQFKNAVQKLIIEICNRGSVPIMVGGSGMYVDAIIYDYRFAEAADINKRQQLKKLTLQDLQHKAHALGIEESRIDFQNRRHLQRAVETGGVIKQRKELRPNTIIVGVQRDKATLERRIKARIDAMFEQGLVEEVKQVAERFGTEVEAMKGLGYKAVLNYLDGGCTVEEAKQILVRSDLRLAKKQRTWFKRNKSIHWSDDPNKLVELVTTYLNTR